MVTNFIILHLKVFPRLPSFMNFDSATIHKLPHLDFAEQIGCLVSAIQLACPTQSMLTTNSSRVSKF